MARVSKVRHEGDRLTDLVNIGVLTTRFPLDQIHEVLRDSRKASKRVRDLPAHVMMYYVIALSLYVRKVRARCCGSCWRDCRRSLGWE
jgi:hypothetical protein